jgi:hypothetical protein
METGDLMSEPGEVVVERVRDEGQWFDQGERVEFFPRAAGRLQPALEKAALGSYEVFSCTRVSAEGSRWLDVRLGSVFSTRRVRRPSAHAAGLSAGA